MLPALRDGELRFIRTDPAALRRLRRRDIVVLRHPWNPSLKLIKRIAAVPGDCVRGTSGPQTTPTGADRRLCADEYLVLSDNAAEGVDDGRLFGPIPKRLIEGRLFTRFHGSAAPFVVDPAQDARNPDTARTTPSDSLKP
jgi:hypothetical protein